MRKEWKVRIIIGWILVMALLLLRTEAESKAFELVELREVSITYRTFFDGGIDPMITQNTYLPHRAMDHELNLTVNADLAKYFYWDNVIHSMTDKDAITGDKGQFRMVGWEAGLGIDLRRIWSVIPVRVGLHHLSRHILDEKYSHGAYPREDAVEIKLFLYERK